MHQFSYIFLWITLTLWSCNGAAKREQQRQDSLARQDSIQKIERKKNRKTILFLGNSLAAGFGLDNPEESAYPALIQKKLDAGNHNYRVVNAGVSGETTTGGRERINFLLKQKVDILVIELGGNDGLRGVSPQVVKENLQQIIDIARKRYKKIKVLLVRMEAPPNLGLDYTAGFTKAFDDLEEDNRKVVTVPFILDGIAGKPELNQSDGTHPTAEGHEVIANKIWKYLQKVL
ncbi:arylesterase [uncultured Microscilla sp.]|uniref:arylesterase n=1 Tax=uncultured Microscilla sp. TaxID=432653 RepID=UPI00261F0C32|nr:arylesterase [uncultured Microscilla sp.]